MRTRTQLTLFVPPADATNLEAIRRIVDPVQQRLIPAHVTLCREDEVSDVDLAELRQRIVHARPGSLTLRFGAPERFGEHGLLLPCVEGIAAFQALRTVVLAAPDARDHAPHLTLAHPRNPRAPGNSLANAASLREGVSLTFDAVHHIAQHDGHPWVVRDAVSLISTEEAERA